MPARSASKDSPGASCWKTLQCFKGNYPPNTQSGDLLHELRDHRHVIGRLIHRALNLIYPCARAASGQGLGSPHVIDAQAVVAPERSRPIIPPGVESRPVVVS